MNFRLLDSAGKTLAVSRSLPELQRDYAASASDAFTDIPAWNIEKQHLVRWDFGDLPAVVRQRHRGMEIVGYPALTVDELGEQAITVFDDPASAAEHHHAGVLAMILRELPEQARYLQRDLPDIDKQCLLFSGIGSCNALREDLVNATLDHCFLAQGDVPYRQRDFFDMLEHGKAALATSAMRLCHLNFEALTLYHEVMLELQHETGSAGEDIQLQLGHLFYIGYLQQTGIERLAHYPRYLKGIRYRLQQLEQKPQRDQQAMQQLLPFRDRYLNAVEAWDELSIEQQAELEKFHWLLEEYRISLFAQQLGTATPVSAQRLDRMVDELLS
jgi:ATP-dependent helicase HrpA